MPTVFALGLDPAFVDPPDRPHPTPDLVRTFIDARLERLRSLGIAGQP
jgi:hypothetical protein